MIIQFLVSLAATLSFAVLFSAEKKTVVFLRSDRCPRLDRLPDLLTVSHRQCDCKPDRHLCTDTGCTDSFGSAQNSGHGVPAHRNLPTCSRCRNLLYLLLLYHGRYEPVLTVRNQYCESCRFDRAWHYLRFCASTEPL